jgi:hypothetical protein
MKSNLSKKKLAKEVLIFFSTGTVILLLFLSRFLIVNRLENRIQILEDDKYYIEGYAKYSISSFYRNTMINRQELLTILTFYATRREPTTIFISVSDALNYKDIYQSIKEQYILIPSKSKVQAIFIQDVQTYDKIKSFFLEMGTIYSDQLAKKTRILDISSNYFPYFLFLILIIVYPIRLIIYTIKWSIITLKE